MEVAIYTVVGGTKAKPLLVPEVYLSKPVSSSAEDVSRTIILIPYGKDEATGETKYYLYDPGTHEESGYNASLDLIADIFAISSNNGYAMNAPGRWYNVTGTIADGAGTFTDSSVMSGYGCRDIKEYISGIYGSKEIYFVTSSAFDSAYGSKFSFIQATSIVESTTVYLGNKAVFETTITGVKDGENADAIERLNYQSGNVPAKNLDNVEISLTLGNTTTGEDVAGYGFTQLDFANSKIELVYYGENTNYIEETVYEWPLLEAKEQSVVIPEGITTKTGWYGLRVVITNANGTVANDAKQQFYFMDNCELDVSLDAYYKSLEFTADPTKLKEAKFHIVAVPTPVNDDHTPDLTPVEGASRLLGQNLTKGSIVVFESTVYPGVTEDVCVPILEKESGLKCGVDFKIGYSPERINPGDKVHRLETIVKIVSGMDEETLDEVAKVYELVVEAGVHRAESIKVAEAAKVIEKSQRDINIAFMNELSIIFNKMGIDTKAVLEAAGTKWNFLKFFPGLVGGHCIGVDPYYLTYKAEQLGYHSQVVLAGRRINATVSTLYY